MPARQFNRFYRAFLRKDERFHGRAFIAVRTTGIYCLLTCRARTPRRRNVSFYFSRAAAERDGFRPCRKCRPELAGGRRGQERATLTRWLGEMAEGEANCRDLARARGVSSSRLYRMFRRQFGHGPRRARAVARLDRACALLRAGEPNITRAAFDAGFSSVSTFYRWFRRTLGITPSEFRRRAATPQQSLVSTRRSA